MTITDTAWRTRARKLAERLAENGVLDDPAWRAAFESVPRHVFVPRFYRQRPDGEWSETTVEDDGWLDAVYSDEPLVTALAEIASGSRVTVSSSSKPALMARMLAALDVHDGMKVLEIGTGTGYNAALLAHRLGGEHVFSVDIGADLVETAGSGWPNSATPRRSRRCTAPVACRSTRRTTGSSARCRCPPCRGRGPSNSGTAGAC